MPERRIGELLDGAAQALAAAGIDDAPREAAWLLSHLVGCGPASLGLRREETLDATRAGRFAGWIERRAAREPAQYISGEQEFHGLPFAVRPGVLIPRPETEGLVDAALAGGFEPGDRVADLGCGSGAIAVTIAVRSPRVRVFALDRDEAALAATRENAQRHGVAERVTVARGDFARPPAAWRGRMALVVSNPPYVREAEWRDLEPEVRDHEPRRALVAGGDGLAAYRALLPAAAALLRPGGRLLLELGHDQAGSLRDLCVAAGFLDVEVAPDLRGLPRILSAGRPGAPA